MTFIAKRKIECDQCKETIQVGQTAYLKNDKNIVCIKCIYLIDKLNKKV